jgi:hypothetical protein
MMLNSSSLICLQAHSSAVTYLHPLEGWHFFFGFGGGNFGFFTIFCEVVDDIPLDGSFALIGIGVRDRCEELDVIVVEAWDDSRWKHLYVAVAVVDGGLTFAALYVSITVFAPTVFAAQYDDGRVGGTRRWR